MSKYIAVKNAIANLEQGRFQTLCNEFLKSEYNGDLHSPGTVDDGEKTRKGRPDSYIHGATGGFVICEFTTQDDRNAKQFEAKLKGDLEDCLNFEKLDIQQKDVEQIIIGCNSSVPIALTKELREMVPENMGFRTIGIETLSTYFSRAGKLFARDFLNVEYDTGQILTKAEFLKRYGKKDLATPLDNQLCGRETELDNLVETIASDDLIVLAGPAGAGKTKLSIEAIDRFVTSNPDYTPYYIFDKSGSIADDLLSYLNDSKKYLLLVDDGNRQINNLLAVIQQAEEGGATVKVLITVRDYAKAEVMRLLRNKTSVPVYLDNLRDEVIQKIIIAGPFSITMPSAVNRITQIAKGNPRLAIMAARVYNKNKSMDSINDVSNIYHDYFQSVIDDQKVFDDATTRKVMGLLAFFKSIDIEEESDRILLSSFGIDVSDFFAVSEQLETMELVNIYDRSVVRIAEQILATYYFYLTFIKDRNISFEQLLREYFAKNFYHFKDAVLPVFEAFGPQNIIPGLKPILLSYLDAISGEVFIALQFLDMFGIYLPEQTLSYIYNLIEAKKNGLDISFTNDHHQQDDKIINVLSPFFKKSSTDLGTALELACTYGNMIEDAIKPLTETLKQSFYPTDIDLDENCSRQHLLLDYLNQSFENSVFAAQLFYAVLPNVLLGDHFSQNYYVKNGSETVFHPIYEALRSKYWQAVLDKFDNNRAFGLEMLIREYVDDAYHDLFALSFDGPYIAQLIHEKLDPERFLDCYFVQGFIGTLTERYHKIPPGYQFYAEKFTNPTYQVYDALIFKFIEDEEIRRKHDFVEKHRQQLLKNALPISLMADFKMVMEHVTVICDELPKAASEISDGLGRLFVVITFQKPNLALDCLRHFLERNIMTGINPGRIFKAFHQKAKSKNRALYKLIVGTSFVYRQYWMERYFDCLPEDLITIQSAEELLLCYQDTLSSNSPIYVSYLLAYEHVRKDTIYELIHNLYQRREIDRNFVYKIDDKFYTEFPQIIKEHPEFARDLYFQQESIDFHFDMEGEQFELLLAEIPNFLDLYIDYLIKKRGYSYYSNRKSLGRIWNKANSKILIKNAIMKIGNTEYLYSAADICSIFIHPLTTEHLTDALQMFDELISENSGNIRMLNLILNITRNHMPKVYWDYVSKVIRSNTDIEVFKKFQFYNNHFSSSGDQIWEDFKVAQLGKVHEILASLPDRLQYISHRDWLSRVISDYQRYADRERKMIFRGLR